MVMTNQIILIGQHLQINWFYSIPRLGVTEMSINKVNVWKRFDLKLYNFDYAHYHGNADPAGINKPQCLDLN
jgi:hypothetical protein